MKFVYRAALLLFALYFFSGAAVRITVTQSKLDSVCGTHAVKLVYVNQNYLWYIDFSEPVPQPHLINVASAYFPVISPDGRYVTYQTGSESEGLAVNPLPGKIWFRSLSAATTAVQVADTAYVPRFVQTAPADTPEIVYATTVTCPSGICYNNGQTIKRKIISTIAQAPQIVSGSGSYYGGLSYDNRYLCTGWPGGPNAFMLDLVVGGLPSAVHTMRVKKNITNADTVVSIGTCNISRSASRIFTNTMLYYDFGSAALHSAGCYHPILGTWDTHAKLFISRYDSQDLKVFDMPGDRRLVPTNVAKNGDAIAKEWWNPEWSNHPYFAVASLQIDRLFGSSPDWDHRYNCESVYLINLKDSVYVKLLESTDTAITSTASFTYPWVWVDTGAGFREDPSWLAQTIWERNGQSVQYPIRGSFTHRLRTVFSNGRSLKHITLFTLTGAKAGFAQRIPDGPVQLDRIFQAIPRGTYLVAFETRSGEKTKIRWVKPK